MPVSLAIPGGLPLASATLATADLVVLGTYLAVTVLLGVWPRKSAQTAEGYLLGGRDVPWPLLLFSIVATETSTVTFLSLPGKSFAEGGNLTFLQITAGYIAGRMLVTLLLLPEFFRGQVFTAYEVLEDRFGPGVRQAASLLFLVCRTLADGLRLFLTGLALQQAMGWDLVSCVLVLTAVTAFYATLGGVSSVVWNDAVQLAVYLGGALVAAWLLIHAVPGGVAAILEFGAQTDRFRWFDPRPGIFGGEMTLFAGFVGGAILSLATHGVDHLMVQRYLCARSKRSAALALGLSGPVVALQFLLFLLIGVGLAALAAKGSGPPLAPDQALAAFLASNTPTGLRGLLFAAVIAAAMSTLSSSLNSSSAVAVRDVLRPLVGPAGADSVRLAQGATIVFALLQAGVALGAHFAGLASSVIDLVLAIAGFTTGILVGLFALGMLRGRCAPSAATAALGAGVLAGLVLFTWNSSADAAWRVHWAWNALVASGSTLAVGYGASLLLKPATR